MKIKSLKVWFGWGLAFAGEASMRILPEDFDWLGWPILFLGLCMLLLALHEWAFNRMGWTFHPLWSAKFQSLWPFIILVPLEKGTEIAYTKLRHTTAADSAGHFDNKELDYFATYFGKAGMNFYGRRNLSSITDLIPRNTAESGRFEGNILTSSVDNKKPWADIKIERKQLTQFIKERNEQ